MEKNTFLSLNKIFDIVISNYLLYDNYHDELRNGVFTYGIRNI